MTIDVDMLLSKADVLSKNQGKLKKVKVLQEQLAKAIKDLPADLVGLFAPPAPPAPPAVDSGKRTRITNDQLNEIIARLQKFLRVNKPTDKARIMYEMTKVGVGNYKEKHVMTALKKMKANKELVMLPVDGRTENHSPLNKGYALVAKK